MLCQKEFVVGSWWFVVVFSSVIYCLRQPFKSLKSWKFGNWPGTFSKDLSIDILASIAKDFRFKDPLRGTWGSIMDNIAEGFERGSKLEFTNSLTIAKDEAGELESQLHRGFDNHYLNQTLFGNYLSWPTALPNCSPPLSTISTNQPSRAKSSRKDTST